MSALITALDNNNLFQTGENGHTEYAWSNNLREKICQLNFQLVRTNESNILLLEKSFKEIIVKLFLVNNEFILMIQSLQLKLKF